MPVDTFQATGASEDLRANESRSMDDTREFGRQAADGGGRGAISTLQKGHLNGVDGNFTSCQ